MTRSRWGAVLLGIGAAQLLLAVVYLVTGEKGPGTWAQLVSGACLLVVGGSLVRQR